MSFHLSVSLDLSICSWPFQVCLCLTRPPRHDDDVVSATWRQIPPHNKLRSGLSCDQTNQHDLGACCIPRQTRYFFLRMVPLLYCCIYIYPQLVFTSLLDTTTSTSTRPATAAVARSERLRLSAEKFRRTTHPYVLVWVV